MYSASAGEGDLDRLVFFYGAMARSGSTKGSNQADDESSKRPSLAPLFPLQEKWFNIASRRLIIEMNYRVNYRWQFSII